MTELPESPADFARVGWLSRLASRVAAGWLIALGLVTVVSGLLTTITPLGPASAQTPSTSSESTSTTDTAASGTDSTNPDQPVPDENVDLVSQSNWVAPEDTFRMTLGINSEVQPDSRLSVRVYNKVSGRIRFSQSIEGGGLGSPLQPLLDPIPVGEVPHTANGQLLVEIPVSAETTPESGVRLSAPGVYPVSVAITDTAGRELDNFITYLIRLPDGEITSPKLAVSLVVPIHAPPAKQPNGEISFTEADVNHLDSLAQSLSQSNTIPMTLVPTPETIDSIAALGATNDDASRRFASIISALRASTPDSQIISSPYVPLDLGGWAAANMDGWFQRQLVQGISSVSTALGRPPGTTTWVGDETITPEALDLLYANQVRQLIMPSELLSDPPSPWSEVTFTNTFEVTTSDGSVLRAASADDELAGRLEATPDPVLNAHLALADLAVLYFDRPSRARGVALVLPSDASVPAATLDAFTKGLDDNPLVGAVTADDLFDVTDPAGISGVAEDDTEILEREFRSEQPVVLTDLKDGLAATDARLVGLRSMIGDAPEVIAPVENRMLIAGSREIDTEQSEAYLDGAVDQIGSITAGVTAPPRQVVTLTARSAKIPLSIDNHFDYAVRVKVHLVSEKLVFPEGDVIEVNLAPAGTTRLEVHVEARASGAFPVDVELTSPDDSLDLGSTRVIVRSTAISGLGLALSVGAGIFLAIWWLRHFRSARRARSLVASQDPPSGSEKKDLDGGSDEKSDEMVSTDNPGSYAPADHD